MLTVSTADRARVLPWSGGISLHRLSQGGWAVTDQALFALSNFTVNILLARMMPPVEYGVFAVAFSLFLLLGVVHTGFFAEPMLVHGPSDQFRRSLNSYLTVLTRGHFLIASIVGLVLLTTSISMTLAGERTLAPALLGLALMSPLALFLWLSRRACYVLRLPRLAASGGALYMCLLLGGVLLLSSRQWLSPLTALCLMGVGSLASGAWLLHRVFALSGSQEDISKAEVAKYHLQYGVWAAPSGVLSWVVGSAPITLVALWGGYEAAAMLKALTNLLIPALHAFSAVSLLLLPSLVTRRGTIGFQRLTRVALAALLAGGVAYALPLTLFARPILTLAYGGAYDPVATWLPPLALLLLFSAISTTFGSALRAVRRPDLVLRGYACAAATTLILAIPLLRAWGIGGAVMLLIASNGLLALVMLLAGRKAPTVAA